VGKGSVPRAALGFTPQARDKREASQKGGATLIYNVGSGTMSPFQHGEVGRPTTGAETDLELGPYENGLRPSRRQKT